MKKILILILGLTINFTLFSHPWKPNHYVIIDTDGGIDDMRTITMLLASPDVRVLAITVSPGALSTASAYIKVKSLVNSFHHEGVPVGINMSSIFKSPEFPVALNTEWGEESDLNVKNAPDCINLIYEILSIENTKVSFICLGGLTTANLSMKEIPVFKQQIKEIIWSSDGLSDKEGFNYQIDILSAENVLKGDIPVRVVKGLGDTIFFSDAIIKRISDIPSVYAEKFSGFFNSETARSHEYSFRANDEMVALYLHYPELFQIDTITNDFNCTPVDASLLREYSLKILSGETVVKNQVISDFPVYPSFYFADIEPFVSDIIKAYGMEEWRSGVIANELHRHLGVFTIAGVKMGIRAREFFATGVDEFSVTSFAGSVPPLSCMNDGLQVSTGATPGHGLLTVSRDSVTGPVAEFIYLNRKIRITLKPAIAQIIISELKELNFVYGLDSNIYWELVRKNSIKYWLNLDRHDIFVIEEIL